MLSHSYIVRRDKGNKNKNKTLVGGTFFLLLEYGHAPRMKWRVGGGEAYPLFILHCFGLLPKRSFKFHKSHITSKLGDVELPVIKLAVRIHQRNFIYPRISQLLFKFRSWSNFANQTRILS